MQVARSGQKNIPSSMKKLSHDAVFGNICCRIVKRFFSRHLSIDTCHPSAGPLTRHCRAPRTSAREREFPVAWRLRCPSLVCGVRWAAPSSSSSSACQGGLPQKATHNELRQEGCYRKWRLLSNTCLGHVTGKCIHFIKNFEGGNGNEGGRNLKNTPRVRPVNRDHT